MHTYQESKVIEPMNRGRIKARFRRNTINMINIELAFIIKPCNTGNNNQKRGNNK